MSMFKAKAVKSKFWLQPSIVLAQSAGLSQHGISQALRLVQEHENDISSAWRKHFPS